MNKVINKSLKLLLIVTLIPIGYLINWEVKMLKTLYAMDQGIPTELLNSFIQIVYIFAFPTFLTFATLLLLKVITTDSEIQSTLSEGTVIEKKIEKLFGKPMRYYVKIINTKEKRKVYVDPAIYEKISLKQEVTVLGDLIPEI